MGWAIDPVALVVKPGTMAGAIPAFFIGIPLQLTAQMRASGGHSVNFTGFVPVDAELLPVNLHNAPVALGQLLQGNPPGLPKLAAQPPDGLKRVLCQLLGRGAQVEAVRRKYGEILRRRPP